VTDYETPIPWREVERDIQEAIYAFAVLTRAGIPRGDILVGWARVANAPDPNLLHMVVRVGLCTITVNALCVDDIGSSFPGEDYEAAHARFMRGMAAWNALPLPEREAPVEDSLARANAVQLLGVIARKNRLPAVGRS